MSDQPEFCLQQESCQVSLARIPVAVSFSNFPPTDPLLWSLPVNPHLSLLVTELILFLLLQDPTVMVPLNKICLTVFNMCQNNFSARVTLVRVASGGGDKNLIEVDWRDNEWGWIGESKYKYLKGKHRNEAMEGDTDPIENIKDDDTWAIHPFSQDCK